MKINKHHFSLMEKSINEAMVKHSSTINSNYLTDKRKRWDLLRLAVFPSNYGNYQVNGITWICDNLYGYLDDSHIDTALKKITGIKG